MKEEKEKKSKTYCDEETKNILFKLFRIRSHVARIYAYLLILGIIVLFTLGLILIIYQGFFSTDAPNYTSDSDYVNLGIRLAVLTIIFVFAKILFSTYQSFMSMARFYDARADALKMLGKDFNVPDYEKICNLLTLPSHIWCRKVDIQTNILPELKK